MGTLLYIILAYHEHTVDTTVTQTVSTSIPKGLQHRPCTLRDPLRYAVGHVQYHDHA